MKQPGTDSVVVKSVVIRSRKWLALLLVCTLLCTYSLASFSLVKDTPLPQKGVWQNKLFPKPQAIEKDVQFWKQVYTKISTSEGYIHDNADLSVIYEKIKLPPNLGYKARSRYTKKLKNKYIKILDKLAKVLRVNTDKKNRSARLSKEEKRVLSLWPEQVTYKELLKAKKQIRFQLGQANKFKEGVIRSGRWKPYIISILKEMDLPLEIAALPHVESSFNYKAYSKVGAAGMWQFTRSTGRRYMRVDHVIDERLDPFIATLAAARLLKNNYAVTGTWPLALTAYNHGAAGMRRASKKVGTTDIVTILRKYKSRSFGFASRNFYPSFLAALEVSNQPEKYFKNIKLAPPVNMEFVSLSDYISIETIIETLSIERADLMAANPALRPAIWNGNKYIPKTYELRLDRSLTNNVAELISQLVNIDADKRFKNQKADRYHRVTKGQTLSIIAARYGIKMSDLIASNNMRNKHVIRIGQVLVLPQKTDKQIQLAIKKKEKVKEKNPPKFEPIAIPEDGIYIVKKGDSLDRIARKNSISLRQLLKLNNLRNKNKIYPGQKLVLIKPEDISKQKQVQLAQLEGKPTEKNQVIVEAFDLGETQPITIKDEEPTLIRTALVEKEIKSSTPVVTKDIVVVNKEQITALPEPDKDLLIMEETSLDTEVVIAAVDNSLSAPKTESPTDSDTIFNGNGIKEESVSELLADPSDYSVNDNNSIEIQAAETLGHYAEWLQIRARDLRRLNKMKYGKHVVVGKQLKLNFKKVTPREFEAQRVLYHKTLQEEFFEQNQIIGVDKYRLNRGDSVWRLTKRTYKIPFWLLRQYNPDLDMNRISANKIIRFPKVKQRKI
ncbi:MAG: LysM peptidoglycan-binding domain-containing protein [Gammaproteobacteria bacterium]|nr:LysM peptidoglycan-binding domain-containing protein [Gammaproteobacteria bacterium]